MFNAMNDSQQIMTRLRLLKILSSESDLSQRELAQRMGISLGKTNYCLTELVKKGLVKMQRFSESKAKLRYLYILTPRGIEAKGVLAIEFLRRKLQEYEEIRQQIEEVNREIQKEEMTPAMAKELEDLIGQATD